MGTKTLQSLERGLDALFSFRAEKRFLSLQEISVGLGISRTAGYRLLATLCNKRVVAKTPAVRGYELDARLLRLQAGLQAHIDLARIALPSLRKLSRHSGETAVLCVLQSHEIVCTEAVSSPHAIRFTPEKGHILPLYASALGRVILAFLPDFLPTYARKVALRPLTPYTITDAKKLGLILAQIRARTWATSFQQLVVGGREVAVPIFGATHSANASLGIFGPHPRFTNPTARELVPMLQYEAGIIAKTFGATAAERHRAARELEINRVEV